MYDKKTWRFNVNLKMCTWISHIVIQMNYNTLNKQVKRKPRVLHTTRLQQSQCSFPFASGFAGWNGAVVTDKIRLRLKIKRIRRSPFHLWQANRMSQVPKLMRSSTKNTWGYGCIMQTESRQKGRGESMWCGYFFPRRTHREVDVAHPQMMGQATPEWIQATLIAGISASNAIAICQRLLRAKQLMTSACSVIKRQQAMMYTS